MPNNGNGKDDWTGGVDLDGDDDGKSLNRGRGSSGGPAQREGETGETGGATSTTSDGGLYAREFNFPPPSGQIPPTTTDDGPGAWTESTTFGIPEVIEYFGGALSDGIFDPTFIYTRIPIGAVQESTGTVIVYNTAETFQEIVEVRNNSGTSKVDTLGPLFARSEIGIDVAAETMQGNNYLDLGNTGYVYGLMYFEDTYAVTVTELPDIVALPTEWHAPTWIADIMTFGDAFMHYTAMELDFLSDRFGYASDAINFSATGDVETVYTYYKSLVDQRIASLTSQIYVSDIGNQIVNKTIDLGPIEKNEVTSISAKETEQGVSTFVTGAPSEVSTSGY